MNHALALAEIANIKAQRRASLEQCIAAIDDKPAHPFLAALRTEFRGVLTIWDAEAALAQPTPSKPTAPAPAEAKASSATAPAAPAVVKKRKSWVARALATFNS